MTTDLIQTLGNSLAQMRAGSDRFVLFSIGQDYACVARRGTTAEGAILLSRVSGDATFGARARRRCATQRDDFSR